MRKETSSYVLRRERVGAGAQVGVVVEEMRHVGAQHAAAGARGHDHVIIAAERIEDAAREVARGGAVAGIIGRLAAAGLRARHLHLAAGLFQQADRGEAHGRAMEIDQAGDEQRDARL